MVAGTIRLLQKVFKILFKNVVINNYNIKSSVKGNCEEDVFKGLVNDMRNLLDHQYDNDFTYDQDIDNITYYHEQNYSHEKIVVLEIINKYLNNKLSVNILNCSVCKPNIFEIDFLNDGANDRRFIINALKIFRI